MKRILAVVLIALFLICGVASAANVVSKEMMNYSFDNTTPFGATSDTIAIQGFDKVAFFVTYNETETGGGVSAAVTVDVSTDDSTWLDASFYDYAGGSTLQTSETISADGSYYMWFNKDLTVPYARVVINATGTDVDDLLSVQVWEVAKE